MSMGFAICAPARVAFWSAIILQSWGSVSVPASSTVNVVIQPPSNETWLVWIDFAIDISVPGTYVRYCDYDGTNVRIHTLFFTGGSYGDVRPHLGVLKVLTNTLYACLQFCNAAPSTFPGYYGYSGFKLSQPLWTPRRLDSVPAKPLKLSTDLPLPDPIKPLDKYKALILGLDPSKPGDYALGIVLEEDTPLAVDPDTGFPVERKSVYISANALADLVVQFRKSTIDYVKAGFEPYLRRWKSEGIDLGVL
jgi:hypothetical protein